MNQQIASERRGTSNSVAYSKRMKRVLKNGAIETILKKAYRWNYAESPDHANQKRLRGNQERLRPRDLNSSERTHTLMHNKTFKKNFYQTLAGYNALQLMVFQQF